MDTSQTVSIKHHSTYKSHVSAGEHRLKLTGQQPQVPQGATQPQQSQPGKGEAGAARPGALFPQADPTGPSGPEEEPFWTVLTFPQGEQFGLLPGCFAVLSKVLVCKCCF